MKRNLRDLLEHEIKDLYSAETQLLEALPKMASAASHDRLRRAFESHLEETKNQKQRLEEIARKLDIKPGGESCEAMQGLIREGEQMIDMEADDDVRDAGLIGAAQRVEHYEIAAYGTARQYAERLGKNDIARLLNETLREESGADKKLNKLAVEKINEEATA